MNISRNFTLGELLVSIDYPDLAAKPFDLDYVVAMNLGRLVCNVLQPLRNRFGRIKVNSGFRPPGLNAAVGGSNDSTHAQGRAADITVVSTPALDVWAVILDEKIKLDFDRIAFYEDEERFHVEVADESQQPRGLLYTADPIWRPVE